MRLRNVIVLGATVGAVVALAEPGSAFAQQRRIYVDPAAPDGGDGRAPETAFNHAQDAVNIARTATQTVQLELLPGQYNEKNILVDVDDLWITGLTELVFDAQGLPTGAVAGGVTEMVASTSDQEHIFIVSGQRVQISNISFRSPNTTVATTDSAVFVDGRQSGAFLISDFYIYRCRIEGYGAGIVSRMANMRMDAMYFTRNRTGAFLSGGIPVPPPTSLVTRLRSVRNLDAGLTVGPYVPTSMYAPMIPPGEAYDGWLGIDVADSDLSDNGRMDLPAGGTTINPAGVGLLISSVNTGAEMTRPNTGFFTIARNRLTNNVAYGFAVDATLPGTAPDNCVLNSGYIVHEIIPQNNTISGNGKNAALFTYETVAQTVARAPGCVTIRATYNVEGPEAASFTNADFFAPYNTMTDPKGSCLNTNLNCLHFELVGSRLTP